jgi:hypothetical protein
MKTALPIMFYAIALTIAQSPAAAQTCSCAAVPILGSMQLASPNNDQWFLGSTYEFHDVSDLIAGSSSVPDLTNRDRTSQALILEASRGISDKWSASILLSAVDHEREVSGNRASASGLGDAVAMVKYSPRSISLYSDTSLTFGLGARIPVGEDDATRVGIPLAEDMQPSTGAYGGMIWIYWARALNESKGARIYASASHAQNGDNDRNYEFGNETTITLGGSYQTQTPWGFNLELSYRDADRDMRDSVEIPNTGGKWLDVIPAVQYHINEKLALKAAAKIPVSRNLNDELQFTTKYAFRLSLSYVFGGTSSQN